MRESGRNRNAKFRSRHSRTIHMCLFTFPHTIYSMHASVSYECHKIYAFTHILCAATSRYMQVAVSAKRDIIKKLIARKCRIRVNMIAVKICNQSSCQRCSRMRERWRNNHFSSNQQPSAHIHYSNICLKCTILTHANHVRMHSTQNAFTILGRTKQNAWHFRKASHHIAHSTNNSSSISHNHNYIIHDGGTADVIGRTQIWSEKIDLSVTINRRDMYA